MEFDVSDDFGVKGDWIINKYNVLILLGIVDRFVIVNIFIDGKMIGVMIVDVDGNWNFDIF